MGAPLNWSRLSDKEKKLFAQRLCMSERGRYIIGQALAYAVRDMKRAEPEYREYSNIEDMEIIGSMLFSAWYDHYSTDTK